MKRWIIVSLVIGLFFMCAGLLYAGGVMKTDMNSGEEVVKTRKFLMHTLGFNLKDIGPKFEAGKIADVKANASSIALAAMVMPPLFKEKYEAVYTGKGKYYKGAVPAEFEAAAEKLLESADALMKAADAGNAGAAKEALIGLPLSCKGCHTAYQGTF